MNKNKTLDFDNELKNLSMGVYVGNEKYVPKDWIKHVRVENNTIFSYLMSKNYN